MPIVQPSAGEAPYIEDGMYTVVCVGVEEKFMEQDKFGKNFKFVIHMQVIGSGDGGDDIIIDPMVNQSWSEKSTLYQYAVAFGCAADLSHPFDTDDLAGKSAQAFITTEELGKWPRVKTITRLPKKAVQSAPRKAQEAAPASSPAEDAGAALAAQADKNALASFWEAAETEADRGTVSEMADTMFGKTVSKLTTAERDELLAELRRGA